MYSLFGDLSLKITDHGHWATNLEALTYVTYCLFKCELHCITHG